VDKHPVVVTTASRSGTADREHRRLRYAQTQAARLLCFVLAVVLPVPLWAKLLLIVGAFTLPWMGVVAANAGPVRQRTERPDAMLDRAEPTRIALEPGRDIDQ
jgi:hypothetical protein